MRASLVVSSKESTCQFRRCGFDPWVGKMSWRRNWQPTPVFLPGKSHGQRNMAGYSPWDHKRAGHNWVTKQQQWRLRPKIWELRSCMLLSMAKQNKTKQNQKPGHDLWEQGDRAISELSSGADSCCALRITHKARASQPHSLLREL